jgi:hypothetical protein
MARPDPGEGRAMTNTTTAIGNDHPSDGPDPSGARRRTGLARLALASENQPKLADAGAIEAVVGAMRLIVHAAAVEAWAFGSPRRAAVRALKAPLEPFLFSKS